MPLNTSVPGVKCAMRSGMLSAFDSYAQENKLRPPVSLLRGESCVVHPSVNLYRKSLCICTDKKTNCSKLPPEATVTSLHGPATHHTCARAWNP
eukprot:2046696-Rhodomonas_salina.2